MAPKTVPSPLSPPDAKEDATSDSINPAAAEPSPVNGTSSSSEAGDAEGRCPHRATPRPNWPLGVSPTISLPLLNLIDMFAVSLVVPLLHQYYRAAGVSSARQRELLSSLFSSSQIAGGLVLGGLTDAGAIGRRTVLFVSFAGSAASYGLIVRGGFRELIASRVVVGLVKQTMTVTTSLMARHTIPEERSTHMGRLSASTTIAWIVGPSVGGLLYKHVDVTAPALCASMLFVVNSVIAAFFLPRDEDGLARPTDLNKEDEKNATSSSKFSSFASNLKSCFSSVSLGSVIVSLLVFSWVTRATSYASMASYYEELYGIEPHQRGYISSYQQLLNFAVQSAMVRPLLKLTGGERRAACIGAALLAGATFLELWSNLTMFVGVICPIVSLSVAMLGLSLRSLVTQVAPKDSLGSVLAALDVLQNAAAVTVPFYRAFLFSLMGKFSSDEEAVMRGDPNPYAWLSSAVIHWMATAAFLCYLLLGSRIKHDLMAGESRKKKDF